MTFRLKKIIRPNPFKLSYPLYCMFSKYDTNSGNITTTTADHYTQFALSKDKHCSKLRKKNN